LNSSHAKTRAVHKENETSDPLACSRICTVASPEKRRQPGWRCSSKSPSRIGVANLNYGERRLATCQSAIAQSNWSKFVKQSTLVKKSKTGQRREVYLQILIFLDVSAKLDYRIENGLFRKLIQILFGDNLYDLFK